MSYNMNIKSIIDSQEFAKKLTDIYGLESVAFQKERFFKAADKFAKLFKTTEISVFSAPGRTEIGGNHTDHQHGAVLAASVNLDTIAIVSSSSAAKIHICSEGYPDLAIDINDLSVREDEINTSFALVRGILQGFVKRGYRIGGFDAYLTSDVINGAGLSSSASYEVLIGTILSHLFNDGRISPVVIAQIGQYAENVYFGKPCGLMDQMACSVGGLIHIDFGNPQTPKIEKVDFDFDKTGYTVCITDAKASHADLTPDYAAIPPEMKAVANYFHKDFLREVKKDDFFRAVPELYKQLSHRAILRAIHYYLDSDCVEDEVMALRSGDFQRFVKDINTSGNSSYKYLQNVYTNHDVAHQPISIALALSQLILEDRGAARIHGGGFAGTILAFVPNDLLEKYRTTLDSVFGKGCSHMMKIRKYGGIRII